MASLLLLEENLWEQVAQFCTGQISLLLSNQQYQNTKEDSLAITQPDNITNWPHPFFIRHQTSDGRDVAPFMTAL